MKEKLKNIFHNKHVSVFRILVGVGIVLVVLSFIWFLLRAHSMRQGEQMRPIVQTETQLSFPQESFELARDAEATFVFDVANETTVFAENEDNILPLASITKIMTTIVALEHAEPETLVTISGDAIAQEGNNFLVEGETWKLGDLLAFMMITSSNDAAYEIARSIPVDGTADVDTFVNAMNDKAYELGLFTMSFANPSGLDVTETDPSAYGSARDVAALLVYGMLTYPDVFQASAKDVAQFASLEFPTHIATNTNVVARQLPALVASKTGYTDNTGGNLAFVFEAGPGRPMVAVILGSTFDGRFVEAEQLTAATINAVQNAR
jgi:D-alanyl-D-alanine carboxypeptidase (penicillin-binding protein 5/6)